MNYKNRSKNELLGKLLIQISDDTELANVENYIKEFESIYSDEDFRHEYSKITNVLFSIDESYEKRAALTAKIEFIEQSIVNEDVLTKMDKLCDHIKLEDIRMTKLINISEKANSATEVAATVSGEIGRSKKQIDNLNQRIDKYNKKTEDFTKSIKNAERKMRDIHQRMNNSTTESITILSIFAGIVMAFSGGMSFISNAISGINKIGPYRLAIFILLIGNIMFNIIFLLIYMIGKVVGRYTGSNSQCFSIKETCKEKTAECYIVKYPYIIWFNFFDIIGIIIALYLDFIDRFNIFTKIFINRELDVLMWISVGLFLIFLFLIKYSWNKIRDCKCKKTNNKEA